MPTIITTEALPNDTFKLTIAFTDEDGSAVTPNDPTTWSLADSAGNTINSRSAVGITEDTSVDVYLQGDDLAATGVYDDGIRLITVTGTYDGGINNLDLNATHWFVIGDNIKPVSLADAKRHLQIPSSNTAHDVYVAQLITAARERAEKFCNRKLMTQTVTDYFDDWPDGDALELRYGGLDSVTSIHYKDTDGDWNEWASSYYTVETADDPGRVVLNYGESWPTTTLHPSKPIRVIYSCGYGSSFGSVPAGIRQAIQIMVSDWFEQREPFIAGVSFKQLNTVEALLWPYKVFVK